MAEIWKPLSIETYKLFVSSILDETSDELNNWELRFVTDIQTKLDCGWQLTQSQAETLERIYTAKTR